MWNSLVSSANGTLGQIIARCVEAAWRHPWISIGFLSTLAILALMLWIELFKDLLRGSGGAGRDEVAEARR